MNIYENSKYTLKLNYLQKITAKNLGYKLRIIAIVIVILAFFVQVIFPDNPFIKLSWKTILLLVVLLFFLMFTVKKEKINTPMEIRFFDDYLVIYLEKIYSYNNKIQQGYYKFLYSDITFFECDAKANKIKITGNKFITTYSYNKDGSIQQNPTFESMWPGDLELEFGIESNLNIVEEIEHHSPIKINVL